MVTIPIVLKARCRQAPREENQNNQKSLLFAKTNLVSLPMLFLQISLFELGLFSSSISATISGDKGKKILSCSLMLARNSFLDGFQEQRKLENLCVCMSVWFPILFFFFFLFIYLFCPPFPSSFSLIKNNNFKIIQ